VGTGKPGPTTRKIQEIFFDIVKGRNKNYDKWLEWV
jgi:branched-chain amino acid aminotransferase